MHILFRSAQLEPLENACNKTEPFRARPPLALEHRYRRRCAHTSGSRGAGPIRGEIPKTPDGRTNDDDDEDDVDADLKDRTIPAMAWV